MNAMYNFLRLTPFLFASAASTCLGRDLGSSSFGSSSIAGGSSFISSFLGSSLTSSLAVGASSGSDSSFEGSSSISVLRIFSSSSLPYK